jgi:hypothetical protein
LRIKYTESFPTEAPNAQATWRLIRKIVDDRLATEVLKKLEKDTESNIA